LSANLYNGVDAATPGAPLPPDTHILAAYIGIPNQFGPDTPHIWTPEEWNVYLTEQPDLRALPIYTHNFPGDPKNDAANAAEAAEQLGWTPHLKGSNRRIIAIDLEVMVDPSYVTPLFDEIDLLGFSPMPYGSAGFVKGNPMGIGYWEALLTRLPPTVLPGGTQGIQWRWGPQWDSNVFSERVYLGCGRGLRHAK